MDLIVAENLSYFDLKLVKNVVEINIDPADLGIIDRSALRYFLTIQIQPYLNAATWDDMPTMDTVEEPVTSIDGVLVARGAFFSIERILQSIVSNTPPVFGQTDILPLPGLIAPFKYVSVVKDGDDLLTTTESPIFYAIRAGINERFFAEWGACFFSKYIGAGKKFLTYNPTRKVLPEQPMFLNFLNNIAPTPLALKLRVYCWYIDGTSDAAPHTVQVQNCQYMEAYSVPVGPSVLGLLSSAVPVSKYMVWLVNESGAVITSMISYFIDWSAHEETRFLVFRNSLGVNETLACVGQTQTSIGVSRDIGERMKPFEAKASFSEKVTNKITGERQLIVNTGWLTASERIWFEDLILSEDIYLQTDREYLPVLLLTDTHISYDTSETLIGRSLVFAYSNKESNFSDLPLLEAGPTRATAWRSYGVGSCELDPFGQRTGNAFITHLEKYYTDDDTAYKPATVKLNAIGQEGYLIPSVSAGCATPLPTNVAYSAIGTYNNSTCGAGYLGGPATIAIAAGRWAADTLALANDKAVAEWNSINNQATADASGTCTALVNNGLTAKYYVFGYNITNTPPADIFSHTIDATRQEAVIHLYAGLWPSGWLEVFAARMTGYLKAPYTGSVTLYCEHDDGVRIWVNGVLVIDNWYNFATDSAVISMVAGEYYPIIIEYYAGTGSNGLKLQWLYPGQALVNVPALNLWS